MYKIITLFLLRFSRDRDPFLVFVLIEQIFIGRPHVTPLRPIKENQAHLYKVPISFIFLIKKLNHQFDFIIIICNLLIYCRTRSFQYHWKFFTLEYNHISIQWSRHMLLMLTSVNHTFKKTSPLTIFSHIL